jgi:hypothetical protein
LAADRKYGIRLPEKSLDIITSGWDPGGPMDTRVVSLLEKEAEE